MRVDREFHDPDLAGFLQTADEAVIAAALAGGEGTRVEALRKALTDGLGSGPASDATPVFQRLLAKYGDYIARDDPAAAARLVHLVVDTCQLLGIQPLMGRDRSGLIPGVRSFPVGRYVIFYQADLSGIEVIRILHGARDVQSL